MRPTVSPTKTAAEQNDSQLAEMTTYTWLNAQWAIAWNPKYRKFDANFNSHSILLLAVIRMSWETKNMTQPHARTGSIVEHMGTKTQIHLQCLHMLPSRTQCKDCLFHELFAILPHTQWNPRSVFCLLCRWGLWVVMVERALLFTCVTWKQPRRL